LQQVLRFTSSGTFTKATYPWLRAIKVKCQGAGGGGGGINSTGSNEIAIGSGGSGGVYSESFITDIAGLATSVTVTVGAGGAGGFAGSTNGSTGGASSFGSLVSANGGFGGALGSAQGVVGFPVVPPRGATVGTGNLVIPGGAAFSSPQTRTDFLFPSLAGGSFLGASDQNTNVSQAGLTGLGYGSGGTSAQNSASQSGRAGGPGAPGIVIVELYA
jgi:hypothetical protein